MPAAVALRCPPTLARCRELALLLRASHVLRVSTTPRRLPAVRNRRAYAVDGNAYLNRAGPRIASGSGERMAVAEPNAARAAAAQVSMRVAITSSSAHPLETAVFARHTGLSELAERPR